jgi:hypothetical protein
MTRLIATTTRCALRTAEVVAPSAADTSVLLREGLLEVSIAENPTTTPGATNSLNPVTSACKRRAATEADHAASQ